MFRKMRLPFGRGLSDEECKEVLTNELRGVLSVLGDDDYPYGTYINHWYCPDDGKIYFHGGKGGHKIDAMKRHDKASFCLIDQGYREDGDWALNFRSVVVFGRIEFVEDQQHAMEISRQLSYKFTDDKEFIEDEVQRSGDFTLCFALVPEQITGKMINES